MVAVSYISTCNNDVTVIKNNNNDVNDCGYNNDVPAQSGSFIGAPSCLTERPETIIWWVIKERFTTQGQNQSIFTPSVLLTPALMLSLHPPALTVIDFNQ